MVQVDGGNTAIRMPLHTSSGDPLHRAGHSRHSRLMAAEGVTAPPVLSVDVNAGEQGHQVGDLDVLE